MQFIDLAAQQARIKDRLDARIQAVLAKGAYIMGPEVREFENELSAFCGARHSIACSNGTDAISLALMARCIGPGDAVFVPAFTFAATAETVALQGATPVFVDVLPDTFNMDIASLQIAIGVAKEAGLKPRAVITVDLFGLPADYDQIEPFASDNGLMLVCDAAQGFGGVYKGRKVGTIGDVTTTSFFPAKPLGCYGDGGAVFTDDDEINEAIQSLRVHGKGTDKYDNTRIGLNARLDTIQAAILLEKLAIFPDEIEKRNVIAKRYNAAFSGNNEVIAPQVPDGLTSVWAQYTVRLPQEKRDGVMAALKEKGIPSVVYYPKPLHEQTAYARFPAAGALEVSMRLSREVLSLPMHPYLDESDQDRVTSALIEAVAAS